MSAAMPPMTTARPAPAPPPLGWPLLPVPDEDGSLAFPDLATSLRQQIEVILSTGRGEQLMHPDFGGGLRAMLHEPNSSAARARIQMAVTETLSLWEKRILLDGVTVEPASGGEVVIRIAYRSVHDLAANLVAVRMTAGAA
jgi:uncharacterized protein